MTSECLPPAMEHYVKLYSGLCRTDPQVAAAVPQPGVLDAALRPELSLAQTVAVFMEAYADRPAVGERVTELVEDPATGVTEQRLTRGFATITYRELWESAGAIAAAWRHDERVPVRTGDFVATLGFVSGDYIAIELALMRLGAVSVPLAVSATPGGLRPMIEETGPRVIAVSVGNLATAAETVSQTGAGPVRKLVVFDYVAAVDAHRRAVASARDRLGPEIVIDTLDQAAATGAARPPVPLEPLSPNAPDRLSLVLYTSGSTGSPKGAMFMERRMRQVLHLNWPGKDHPIIGLLFAPMSHAFGWAVLFNTFVNGGTAYIVARPDLSTLLEDCELVRPTELALIPRLCDMLFQHYQRELTRAGDGREAAVKEQLRDKTLGGRVVWAWYGSAPMSGEMAGFMESVLGLPLHDGYGATETGGLVLADGRPTPRLTQWRLENVPELGYFDTDVPYPRGELILKSATQVSGYLNRPDATAAAFDADGFYHTGDIMAQIAPGQLRYIDRRGSVLKLSQAEFVTVSKLEVVYAASPLIHQIYVYGSSERAYLLAVVVPTPEARQRPDDELKAAIAGSLRQLAEQAGLQSYEIPRDFIVETEPFTVESGLLSGARKLVRPTLEKHYRERLEALYATIAEREASELRRLRESGRDQPVIDTVTRAAQALLGASGAEPGPDTVFIDLGGDSLSAVQFSNLLGEIFGVEVAVSVVISPASDLRAIADHIEQSLGGAAARPTFTTVHGAGLTAVRATDLALGKFIDEETLAKARTLPPSAGEARTVLLTGANGYLGRFLCLAWLERMAASGGRLVCVVRGGSPDRARARLEGAFTGGDSGLLRRFHALGGGPGSRLEVVPGDIGEPNLGLDEATWQELAEDVDLIVHPAALVNHVLPYQQLFGPNVVGTAELIRLALTTRSKQVTYVSTVAAVAAQVSSADEDADVRVTSPERVLDDSYANGYATSKWAGEVLLREAHDAAGLPVAVFRPGMILAHSQFAGQLNVPDMFTRLLLSLIATGIAPGSFYAANSTAAKGAAHYDGLPVDFVAEAITTLGRAATGGYHTYNVLNPHADDASLDAFVDWLTDAGYLIRRIDDYATWYSRFETALRALPDKQKQHSLLPLLHAFARPEPVDGTGLPADRFRAAVRRHGIGAGGDIPHVTPALIQKYAADLKALGLI